MEFLLVIFNVLLYVALIVLAIYVVIWVLGQLGVTLPPQIVKILWVIVVLVVLYWLVSALIGGGPSLPRISVQ